MTGSESKIEEAKRFIEANLHVAGPLEVAEHLDIPYETLRKKFRRMVGVPMGAFLTQTRVKRAQHLLVTTDFRCFEISNEVGFTNEEVGARTFKKHTGMTMQAYRRRKRT